MHTTFDMHHQVDVTRFTVREALWSTAAQIVPLTSRLSRLPKSSHHGQPSQPVTAGMLPNHASISFKHALFLYHPYQILIASLLEVACSLHLIIGFDRVTGILQKAIWLMTVQLKCADVCWCNYHCLFWHVSTKHGLLDTIRRLRMDMLLFRSFVCTHRWHQATYKATVYSGQHISSVVCSRRSVASGKTKHQGWALKRRGSNSGFGRELPGSCTLVCQ